jgi:hypothetical protein
MLNQGTEILYASAIDRGQRGQLWSALTGRPQRLFSLDEIAGACTGRADREVGTRTVPMRQVCGSENRAGDFDRDFNPLQDHNKARWLSVARARQRGRTLPPVVLIQVGDVYFVRDGHHRISVARALRQQTIEARVVVWRVTGPLPWERQTRRPFNLLASFLSRRRQRRQLTAALPIQSC